MIEAQPTGGTRTVAAGLLWTFWGLSIVPFIVLIANFGGQLKDCEVEWLYHAKSYPHFFIYPITFGLAATVFLHRPWIQVVHYLRSLCKPAKTKQIWVIVISMLVVVVFMSYVEFERAPQGSTSEDCSVANSTEPAPSLWELPPEAIWDEDGKRVRELAERQCRCRGSLTDKEKCEFAGEMLRLWEAGGRRVTGTVLAYRVGFVFMTSLFVVLFAAIAIVRSWPSKPESDPEGKRIAGMLFWALSFAAGWLPLRLGYHLEKQSLYPEDPELAFEILIFGIFVVFFLHSAASRWSGIARHDRILHKIVGIISIGAFLAIRYVSNSQSIVDFLVIVLAWFLFNYASAFPFVLKKLFYQGGVVMPIVAALAVGNIRRIFPPGNGPGEDDEE